MEEIQELRYLKSNFESLDYNIIYYKNEVLLIVSNKNNKLVFMHGYFQKDKESENHIIKQNKYNQYVLKENYKLIVFETNPLNAFCPKISDSYKYFRVCLESPFHSQSKYLINEKDYFYDILDNYNIPIKPWQKKGNNIIIFMDSCKDCGYTTNINIFEWVNNCIAKIRKQKCKKKIIIRFKCIREDENKTFEKINDTIKFTHNNKIIKIKDPINNFDYDKNLNIDKNSEQKRDISYIFDDAYCTIINASSICIMSLIYGVPVFTNNKDSLVYGFSNENLKDINKIQYCNRNKLFRLLSNQMFLIKDIKTIDFIKILLSNDYFKKI